MSNANTNETISDTLTVTRQYSDLPNESNPALIKAARYINALPEITKDEMRELLASVGIDADEKPIYRVDKRTRREGGGVVLGFAQRTRHVKEG